MKIGEVKVGMAVKFRNDALECWEHFIVEDVRTIDNEVGIYREKIIVCDSNRPSAFYPHNLIKIDETVAPDHHKKFYLIRRLELDLQGPRE